MACLRGLRVSARFKQDSHMGDELEGQSVDSGYYRGSRVENSR